MDMGTVDRSIERNAIAILWAIWRQRVAFIVTASTLFFATFVTFLLMEPVYEGSTLLIVGQTNLHQPADGTQRGAEFNASLARIAQSDEVIRRAAEKVGIERIVANPESAPTSLLLTIRSRLGLGAAAKTDAAPSEYWLPRLMKQISVRAEPNSDIIRIAVKHRDADVAAQLANAIAQAFVDRQIDIFSRPGAAEFFLRQKERFEDDFQKASERFDQFARSTQTYSADDQRELLLKRLNDLSLSLAHTRSSISEKTAQRQALANQLRSLAPVARSPYVSSLVDSLSGERTAPASPQSKTVEERTGDPPLLLVKVYQDSMVELFKINADVAGAESLLKQQTAEISKITDDLNRLSLNEKDFATLKRAVTQAAANSDLYSRRMIEEQIAAESSAAKFSSVKVLQSASVPFRPVFPNYWLVFVLAVVFGALGGIASALVFSRIEGGHWGMEQTPETDSFDLEQSYRPDYGTHDYARRSDRLYDQRGV